jgi:hypothetical protein
LAHDFQDMDGEPGDFTVSEGHGHPLVTVNYIANIGVICNIILHRVPGPPVLPNLRMKPKVKMKTIHRKKRGSKLVFFASIDPHMSFTPSSGFALSVHLCCLVLINSCKSCELIPSFIKQCLVSCTLGRDSRVMKGRLQG